MKMLCIVLGESQRESRQCDPKPVSQNSNYVVLTGDFLTPPPPKRSMVIDEWKPG